MDINDLRAPWVMRIIDMFVAKRLEELSPESIVAISSKDRRLRAHLPGWNKHQIGQALRAYMDQLNNQCYDIVYRNQEGGGRYFVSKKRSPIAIEMRMEEGVLA